MWVQELDGVILPIKEHMVTDRYKQVALLFEHYDPKKDFKTHYLFFKYNKYKI